MLRIFIISLALISIAGCELFEPRDPEPPTSGGLNFPPANSPDILFQNFINAHREKVIDYYLACLVDEVTLSESYIFVPSSGAVNKYPSLSDWDKNSERIFFNNIISQSGESQIILSLENEQSSTFGDSASYSYDYSISLPSSQETFEGSARFVIHTDSRNIWFITRWEDYQVEDKLSWSDLKGLNY